MAIKHILAPVTGDRSSNHVPLCALRIAEDLNAHVTAMNVPLPVSTYVVPDAIIPPTAYAELRKTLDDVNARRTTQARQDFDSAVAVTKTRIVDTPICNHASTSWVDAAKLDDGTVSSLGRCADLIVIDRPGAGNNFAEMALFESAVFGARRPTLVLPPGAAKLARDNVAIAWNGSAEAMEAVKCALDLVAPGAKITIIQVGDISPGRITADTLMEYLGWHCAAPVLRKISDGVHAPSDILLGEAKAAGAAFLIVGAYSHSRTREMLLGGVTRQFLTGADMPLFMAH